MLINKVLFISLNFTFILSTLQLVSEQFLATMIVPETRSKSNEDYVKKLDIQLQNYMAETNKKLETNDSKIDEVGRKLDVMMDMLFHE